MSGMTAEGELAALGYRQDLRRSLSTFDLLVYGLVFIAPTAPWSPFGFVFNASHGMAPLVYLVGLAAMLFTALSYMTMSRAFPLAGSVYAYAGRGVGPAVGFLAGWAMLLDYLLIPTLVYVMCAAAVNAVFPQAPRPLLVAGFLLANTGINLLGVESTARVSIALLVLQLALVAAFCALALIAIAHGVNGAHLTLSPIWDAQKVNAPLIFRALSIAALSFLGFDAISTLSEEAKGGARAVGAATLWSLIIAAGLFVLQTYLASLLVLDRPQFAKGPEADTAFLGIARLVGGEPFRFIASLFGIALSSLAGALTAQAATARLLFGMARDGRLPRVLAHVGASSRTPDRAILLVAVVSLVLAVSATQQIELLASVVNFGALTGFLALHLSVIVHFVLRRRGGRPDPLRHLVCPLIGFVAIAYVLINAQPQAKLAGLIWLAVGAAVWAGLRVSGQLKPPPRP